MKLAQLNWNQLEQISANNFQGQSIGTVITRLIPYLFIIAGFTMFFYLIYGGYKWMISMNDPKKLESAKLNITYAVVGFLVIFFAYWATRLIGLVFDLDAITNIFR